MDNIRLNSLRFSSEQESDNNDGPSSKGRYSIIHITEEEEQQQLTVKKNPIENDEEKKTKCSNELLHKFKKESKKTMDHFKLARTYFENEKEDKKQTHCIKNSLKNTISLSCKNTLTTKSSLGCLEKTKNLNFNKKKFLQYAKETTDKFEGYIKKSIEKGSAEHFSPLKPKEGSHCSDLTLSILKAEISYTSYALEKYAQKMVSDSKKSNLPRKQKEIKEYFEKKLMTQCLTGKRPPFFQKEGNYKTLYEKEFAISSIHIGELTDLFHEELEMDGDIDNASGERVNLPIRTRYDKQLLGIFSLFLLFAYIIYFSFIKKRKQKKR